MASVAAGSPAIILRDAAASTLGRQRASRVRAFLHAAGLRQRQEGSSGGIVADNDRDRVDDIMEELDALGGTRIAC